VPPVTTAALIFHVIPYGDTSKILRLLTREAGIVSAIARGARRARSRTGERLDVFAEGAATLHMKPHRDLHTLAAFDVSEPHAALGRDVARFAAASALAEIALRCGAEMQAEVYEAAAAGLAAIEHAPGELAETAALLACWGLVAALGYTPSLERCVVCDASIAGSLHFSPEQGGAVCRLHRLGARTANLSRPDREDLSNLVAGRMPGRPLDRRHAAAHRRLLTGFVRYHLTDSHAMPALAFWDAESWNATS
jgi:DNA repair protein RecO (recombination protein O)